jgi:hypothetical protein
MFGDDVWIERQHLRKLFGVQRLFSYQRQHTQADWVRKRQMNSSEVRRAALAFAINQGH